MSNEQLRWLLKVLQPARTLASLPGGGALSEDTHAALLGLAPELYAATLAQMRAEATAAAGELVADPAVAAMVDRLPLPKGAKVVAFGDSLTSDPQSWAVILSEVLTMRRPRDGVSVVLSAVGGETTTHGLVRVGEVIGRRPDWILALLGTNDARTQGPTRPRRSSTTKRPRATSGSCGAESRARRTRAVCGSHPLRSTRRRSRRIRD